MRFVRRPVVLLVLIAAPFLGLLPPTVHLWTAYYHNATCVGACCLVTDGFVELSCGEYIPPATR